ncbi:MAG: ABC transporter permease [Fulvivirga sp.]
MIKSIADAIFRWYCHPDYYPDIQGDLEELYAGHLRNNRSFPQVKYCIDVLLLFRPSLIRPLFKDSNSNTIAMFQNYFKISLRALARHKMFTTINVIGLAIGLTSFLLINEYIRFEKSYDSIHKDSDQLHRVSYLRLNQGGQVIDKDAMASYLTGNVLKKELPEVLNYTVTKKFDEVTIRSGQNLFKENGIISADSNFLELYTYEVIYGSKEPMFNEPWSLVMTQSRAKAYFGDINPVGETLQVLAPYKAELKVTGVIEDIPDNTHYSFDMLFSDKTLEDGDDYGNWDYNNYYVFLKLVQDTDLVSFTDKANAVFRKFDDNESRKLDVHPVRDIYLKSDFTFEPQVLGSEKIVNFLVIISVFILVVAWVNYVNLSTAIALERAREVGLRKVVGAFKYQLVIQFLCEAFLINFIGACVAFLATELLVPFFNQLIGKTIIVHAWSHLPLIYTLVVFFLLGTFVSGFYPALVLSGFKPIAVLKGKFQNSRGGILTRKVLVVFQFTVSVILIAGTVIVYQQLNYMQTADIGISVDKVIHIQRPNSNAETDEEHEAFISRFDAFKDKLRNHSAILAVGGTSNLPGGDATDINSTTTRTRIIGLTERMDGTTYIQYNDDHFLDAVGMKLVAGRDFDREIRSDSAAVMVNEAYLRRFNLPSLEVAVGETLQFGETEDKGKRKIVGVVKDYNRTTLKSQIEPTVYMPWMNANALVIKFSDTQAIDFVEETWASYFPDVPYGYSFLSERFAKLYEQEERFGNTFLVFAGMAVIIALLGLYGLASFISIQRSKEVGVRKVLGASQGQIIYLFYTYFFKLIGVAAILGIPLIYFLMSSWLDNYAYRIDFPWFISLGALIIVGLLAFFTVAHQTSKVARLNAAHILRSE